MHHDVHANDCIYSAILARVTPVINIRLSTSIAMWPDPGIWHPPDSSFSQFERQFVATFFSAFRTSALRFNRLRALGDILTGTQHIVSCTTRSQEPSTIIHTAWRLHLFRRQASAWEALLLSAVPSSRQPKPKCSWWQARPTLCEFSTVASPYASYADIVSWQQVWGCRGLARQLWLGCCA